MIGIIDYDAGNIRSVEKAMKYLGQDVCITRDRDTLLRADRGAEDPAYGMEFPDVSESGQIIQRSGRASVCLFCTLLLSES